MSKALNNALDAVSAMTSRETTEARYDAMPPDVVKSLRVPTHAFHMLSNEVVFAKRMFGVAKAGFRRTGRSEYREDAIYWADRCRAAMRNRSEARLNYIAQKMDHARTYE